ncbi:MAG: pseudouridine synthase [Candidatus Gracilibacteria bacterium]
MKILYEDENYLGFLKPAGMPTTYGDTAECFVGQVKETHPELFNFTGFKEDEGGLLYRLDNETSGLLLFAKNKEAFDEFVGDDSLQKIYLAEVFVQGELKESGEIFDPIVHKSSKKMAVLKPGKKVTHRGKPITCTTHYEHLGGDFYECTITKGARHQIRAHLASMDAPIIGDTLYGGPEDATLHLYCTGIKSDFLNIDVRDAIVG